MPLTGGTPRSYSLPHVDEILGERHRLVVAGDADGAVEVGGRVPVLTVGDADHRTRELPENIVTSAIKQLPSRVFLVKSRGQLLA